VADESDIIVFETRVRKDVVFFSQLANERLVALIFNSGLLESMLVHAKAKDVGLIKLRLEDDSGKGSNLMSHPCTVLIVSPNFSFPILKGNEASS